MAKKDEKRKEIIDGGEKISRDWFESTIKKEYEKFAEKPKADTPSNQKNK